MIQIILFAVLVKMPPAINQSDRIFAEITATCDALGYNDGKTFRLDKNSLGKIFKIHIDFNFYLFASA